VALPAGAVVVLPVRTAAVALPPDTAVVLPAGAVVVLPVRMAVVV
jgi:hypothetical protein